MTNFERLLIELIEEKYEKRRILKEEAKKDGEKIGEEIGEKNSLQKVIANMLKLKMNDQTIMDVTQINESQLQEMKEELKVC